MGKVIKAAISRNWWFYAFSAIAIIMLVASWFVPPVGDINSNALKGVALIFAFATLGAFVKALDMGLDARIAHGDTSLTVGQFDGACPPLSERGSRTRGDMDDEFES